MHCISQGSLYLFKKFKDENWFKQVVLSLENLIFKFNELEETPLEKIESVDMMRILKMETK